MAPISLANKLAIRDLGSHTDLLVRAAFIIPIFSTLVISVRLLIRYNSRQFKQDDVWIIIAGVCIPEIC